MDHLLLLQQVVLRLIFVKDLGEVRDVDVALVERIWNKVRQREFGSKKSVLNGRGRKAFPTSGKSSFYAKKLHKLNSIANQ